MTTYTLKNGDQYLSFEAAFGCIEDRYTTDPLKAIRFATQADAIRNAQAEGWREVVVAEGDDEDTARLRQQVHQARNTLSGIASCSTCAVCRGAAELALGVIGREDKA